MAVIYLRVDDELAGDLRGLAWLNRRSLTAECVAALKEHLAAAPLDGLVPALAEAFRRAREGVPGVH